MLLDDLAAWTAVGVGSVAIVASLLGVALQIQKQWLLSSATLVSQLLAEFNSREFVLCREKCAGIAKRHCDHESVTLIGNNGFGVLGMFEHIAYLVRRGALDQEMVRNKFGWEMVGYYSCFTSEPNLIDALRINYAHKGVYEHYEWLVARLIKSYHAQGISVYDSRGRLTWFEPFLLRETTVSTPSEAAYRVGAATAPSLAATAKSIGGSA